MKKYRIVDVNSRHDTIVIESNNGKNALKKFLRYYAMSTGIYEIHKRCSCWIMSSSYGSYFVAIPVEEGSVLK